MTTPSYPSHAASPSNLLISGMTPASASSPLATAINGQPYSRPTPNSNTLDLNAASLRRPQETSSRLQNGSTMNTSREENPIAVLNRDIATFEKQLEELQRSGEVFYDGLEGALTMEGDSTQVQAALSHLTSQLQTILTSLSRSTIGGLPLYSSTTGAPSTLTAPLNEELLTNLRSSGMQVYEERMRLREGAGMVSHVLASRRGQP